RILGWAAGDMRLRRSRLDRLQGCHPPTTPATRSVTRPFARTTATIPAPRHISGERVWTYPTLLSRGVVDRHRGPSGASAELLRDRMQALRLVEREAQKPAIPVAERHALALTPVIGAPHDPFVERHLTRE